MADEDAFDQHREDSDVRWSEHARVHDRDDADRRRVGEDIVRITERLEAGNGTFAALREQLTRHSEDIEALKPKRKTWAQLGLAAASALSMVVGATWVAAAWIGDRPNDARVGSAIERAVSEHAQHGHPDAEKLVEGVRRDIAEVREEQSAQRERMANIKADVSEIKTDLKALVRRGR